MKILPNPPVAERVPHAVERHGTTVDDPYRWLRDRDDPRTIEYLEAENRYAAEAMEDTEELRETLFQEMVGRIQETDQSVPVRRGPFLYSSRTFEGKQYPALYRRLGTPGAQDELLLDENELAEGHDYLRVIALEPSPNHRLLAYAYDVKGSEEYTIRIKDLETGALLLDEIHGAATGLEWGADGRTLYYTVRDATHRPFRLMRHRLGRDAADDEILLEERDERFYMGLDKAKSGLWLIVHLHSNHTDEIHLLDATRPANRPRLALPRREGVEYDVDQHDDRLFILTNDGAVNFRLVTAPLRDPSPQNWTELLPHDPEVKLESIEMFRDHLVLNHRARGLRGLRVLHLESGEWHEIEFEEPVHAVFSTHDTEFESETVRFVYSSPVTSRSVFDYDMNERTRELRKQQPVLGGFDPSEYVCERIEAEAPDGTKIPISLVHRHDVKLDGSAPAFLYGYGAYGISIDPTFDGTRFNLVDRGFVFAIAHIRGGGDLGRPWYEAGKLRHKPNTFSDFVACAECLIERGYTSPERLAIGGGSAGGLLIGAVLNLRPELFRAAIAKVPFVDVVNTMSDASLPLTVIEWDEWGNPADPTDYAVIRSYSPYDNVAKRPYPHLLVLGGLNDPRVAYWEPAKWTAKLRTVWPEGRLLLLKTEMGAGHSGPSGRYDYLKELAFEQAFLLGALDVA